MGTQQPEAWTGGADLSVHADNQPSNFLVTSLRNLPAHVFLCPVGLCSSRGANFANALDAQVPEPGTPAFLEWMRTLYDEGQRFEAAAATAFTGDAYPHRSLPQSQCLPLLRDWLLQTGTAALPSTPAQEAMTRRLKVMAQHVPDMASDPATMMTKSGLL